MTENFPVIVRHGLRTWIPAGSGRKPNRLILCLGSLPLASFSISFFAFLSSLALCFQRLFALPAHSPALFHSPLQEVQLPEVGM